MSALGAQDEDAEDRIQWIKMKHEGNASFAAFAQGELGENLGVCASTVGPGALHLVNGLYSARKERSPGDHRAGAGGAPWNATRRST